MLHLSRELDLNSNSSFRGRRAVCGRNPTAEQDAGANIGAADGPQGEPQDVASLSNTPTKNGFRTSPRRGLVRNDDRFFVASG